MEPGRKPSLWILYEDRAILIINKPGNGSASGRRKYNGTLVNACCTIAIIYPVSGVAQPGIVHRIDKDTTERWPWQKMMKRIGFLAAQLENHHVPSVYRLGRGRSSRRASGGTHGVIRRTEIHGRRAEGKAGSYTLAGPAKISSIR